VFTDSRLNGTQESYSFDVFTADVTFGLMSQGVLPNKTSLICGVDGERNCSCLSVAAISAESKDVFIQELTFIVKHVDPTLPDRKSTWFVDGDMGRIGAIEMVLPMASITICLFHLIENWKFHVASSMRANAGVGTDKNALILKLLGRGVQQRGLKTKSVSELKALIAQTEGAQDVAVNDMDIPDEIDATADDSFELPLQEETGAGQGTCGTDTALRRH